MTFIVVPHGGGDVDTRSFEFSYRRLRWLAGLLLLALVLWGGTMSSWAYVAAQAARVPGLARHVGRLERDRERVVLLAQSLARVEQQYAQVRSMLGADRAEGEGGIRLAPVGAAGVAAAVSSEADSTALPNLWPLGARGFVTREHLGRVPGQHPGIDIAVARGSEIRAAGAGVVIAAGENPVYGKFVRIRHASGYETMYGHASALFVRPNQPVAQGQIIGRSGNTGRSTAPHLHFEIRKDGEPIDPRTLVQAPRGRTGGSRPGP